VQIRRLGSGNKRRPVMIIYFAIQAERCQGTEGFGLIPELTNPSSDLCEPEQEFGSGWGTAILLPRLRRTGSWPWPTRAGCPVASRDIKGGARS